MKDVRMQVLFYKTPVGRDVVLDFIRGLPTEDRAALGADLKVLELRYPLGMPLCRAMGNGLWELRSSLPSKREARLFYFYDRSRKAVVVVHGMLKTSRTTPKRDLDLALKRMNTMN